MSESSKTFLSNLSNESLFFLNIDLKMCAILLFIILVFIFTISSAASMFPPPRRMNMYENFSTDNYYSYKSMDYSNYSSIPLTAPNISKNNQSPRNLLFGNANRIISSGADGKLYYNIEVTANLYVLGGQVYDRPNQKLIQQDYIVQLVNSKNNKSFVVGNLKRDGDGLYKLKYKVDVNNIPSAIGDVNELANYNIVQVIYITKDLSGKILSSDTIIEGKL
jgi:hypothetical protein